MLGEARFEVEIAQFGFVHEIPEAWDDHDYRLLLEKMQISDAWRLQGKQIRKRCIDGLRQRDPMVAARYVIEHKTGGRLDRNELLQLCVNANDRKIWQSSARVALRRNLFDAASLLYTVFPDHFPKPDGISVILHIYARNDHARQIMRGDVSPAFVLRLINDCEQIETGVSKHGLDAEYQAEEAGIWRIQSDRRKLFTSVRIFGSGEPLLSFRDVEYFYCSPVLES